MPATRRIVSATPPSPTEQPLPSTLSEASPLEDLVSDGVEVVEVKEEGGTPLPSPAAKAVAIIKGSTLPGLVQHRTSTDRVKWLNILDHGDNGSGKTRFSGSLITQMKTFYITVDEREIQTLDQNGITEFDYHVLKDYSKIDDLYRMLLRNKEHYEGLVLDGLADLQQEMKDVQLSNGVDNLKTNSQKLEFVTKAMLGKGPQMEIKKWGNIGEMMRQVINPFLDLPMHKVITCTSEGAIDPGTGEVKLYPSLQGGMQQRIRGPFNVVAYSFIKFYGGKAYYCMTTQPHENISTKDRTGLNRVLINPTFKMFLDAHQGKTPPMDQNSVAYAIQTRLIVKPTVVTIEAKGK